MRSRLFHAVVVLGASMGALAGAAACTGRNETPTQGAMTPVDESPATNDAATGPGESGDAAADAAPDATDAADAEDGWQPTK